MSGFNFTREELGSLLVRGYLTILEEELIEDMIRAHTEVDDLNNRINNLLDLVMYG